MADRRVVRLISTSQFPRLLEEAKESPVVFERDGEVYRLSRQSADSVVHDDFVDAAKEDTNESEQLESVLERIRKRNEDAQKHELVHTDSTELIRRYRLERTAELLRASGSFTRDDPLWWDVAQFTIDDLLRARQAIYGDKAPSEDSTEVLRRERELRSNDAGF